MSSDTSMVRGQSDHGEAVAAVSLKGSVFTLPILKLHQPDFAAIERDLQSHLATAPGFFKESPMVLDLADVPDQPIDFSKLRSLLLGYDLVPVAVQHASEAQRVAAKKQGMGVIPSREAVSPAAKQADTPEPEAPLEQPASNEPAEELVEIVQDIVYDQTMVMQQPIRGGQRIYARGGDLIQLAMVNPGAEIIADGNIHIYAPLRGRALAGVNGDVEARIFCHSFEAELVAVAGNYRVFEDDIPPELFKKSVQIYLQDEQLIISPI